MRAKPVITDQFEEHRDGRWRREGARQVETAADAERFVEQVGFAACLTDSRKPGPSLYVAVTWVVKDEVIKRGKVYYGKLARGRATFLAPRMIPYYHAIWGMRKAEEKDRLSPAAQAILKVLRKEWEMATSDLRKDSGVTDRVAFTKAIDELQAAMIVMPSEVLYLPKFTYIWTLGVGRFPDGLRQRVKRAVALREIARCFLDGAGMTIPGELARVTGLSRVEAGLGNRALVKEGYAIMHAPGLYALAGRAPGSTGNREEE
jgi:hypothetical protein